MSLRLQTKEFNDFLVKFEDGKLLVCNRSRILTDGRVRVTESYNVVWGKREDDRAFAEIIDSGPWSSLRSKQIEMEGQARTEESPTSSPVNSPETPSPVKKSRKRKVAQKSNEVKKSVSISLPNINYVNFN